MLACEKSPPLQRERKTREKPFLFPLPLINDPLQAAAQEGHIPTEPYRFVPWENNGGAWRTLHAASCPLPMKALRWPQGDAFLENVLKLPAMWHNLVHSKGKTFFSAEVQL